MAKLKVVFMGSPDFAVNSLQAILEGGYDVAAVVTATDKLGGRGGKQVLMTDVKKFALEHGLRLLQPEKLKSQAFLSELKEIHHDVQVVVAFRMLPEVVWSLPPKGTINVHASLLPKYRGAAPINWAIIQGEKETGVTVFKLQHEIDTGKIIRQAAIPIEDNDNFGTLYNKLKQLGASELIEALNDISTDSAHYLPQSDELASHAPKIFHETCQINFYQGSVQVHNFIRGLCPYPAAWFEFGGQEMKVMTARPIQEKHSLVPGEYRTDYKKNLRIATDDGFIELLRVKYEGKREMEIGDFLNGFHWNQSQP
ncbi:MAG: methionyl-tRNA formyltransferase [Saprospiraceae bacterium]|nr:methionyl-tRNA formyltransferase [Saprospiraceae bacterium]MBK7789641.1 methionyl-tRNA formyltransferase [Saprospiraceae bacterium]MBK9689040.1 methionyl-tRNA formyltransferase [Saprospiraceae bacterium]